jgi:hypothetical protein
MSAKAHVASPRTAADSTGAANTDIAEFDVAAASPEWNPDADSRPGKKK